MFDDPRPAVTLGDVTFKFSQPNVSVDTKNIVAEHDVIKGGGTKGTTVIQKLGEKPPEISLNGICTDEEVDQIDRLVEEERVQFVSNRWEGNVIVMSTSTDPLSDGGAIDKDIDFIHNFDITAKGLEGGTPSGGIMTYFSGYV